MTDIPIETIKRIALIEDIPTDILKIMVALWKADKDKTISVRWKAVIKCADVKVIGDVNQS